MCRCCYTCIVKRPKACMTASLARNGCHTTQRKRLHCETGRGSDVYLYNNSVMRFSL